VDSSEGLDEEREAFINKLKKKGIYNHPEFGENE